MMGQILHFFFGGVSVRYSTLYKCITQIQHITDFSTLQSEMITLLCRIASHALKVCELKVETLQGAILRKISFSVEPLWNEQTKRESDTQIFFNLWVWFEFPRDRRESCPWISKAREAAISFGLIHEEMASVYFDIGSNTIIVWFFLLSFHLREKNKAELC